MYLIFPYFSNLLPVNLLSEAAAAAAAAAVAAAAAAAAARPPYGIGGTSSPLSAREGWNHISIRYASSGGGNAWPIPSTTRKSRWSPASHNASM